MSKPPTENIDRISKILESNKLKISTLHNILQTQNKNTENTLSKIDQFLNGFEIDIKLILSLLDRLKLIYGMNQNYQSEIFCCGCCNCHVGGCFCPCHCKSNCSIINNSCCFSGCNTCEYLNDSLRNDKNKNDLCQDNTRNTSQNNQFDDMNNSDNKKDQNKYLTFNDNIKPYKNNENKDIFFKSENNNEIYNPQNNNDFLNKKNISLTYEYSENGQNNYRDNNFLNNNNLDFNNNQINDDENNYRNNNLNNFNDGNNFLNNNNNPNFVNNSNNKKRSGYIKKISPKIEENPLSFSDDQFTDNKQDKIQNSSISKSKRFQNQNQQQNNKFPDSNNYNDDQNIINNKKNISQKKNKTKKFEVMKITM